MGLKDEIKFTVKNLLQIVNTLNNTFVPNDHILVSLVVVSLFNSLSDELFTQSFKNTRDDYFSKWFIIW